MGGPLVELTDYPTNIRAILSWAVSSGWSLRRVSRFSGIPERTLQNWYEGKRNPPPYIPRLLGKALEAEIGQMYLYV